MARVAVMNTVGAMCFVSFKSWPRGCYTISVIMNFLDSHLQVFVKNSVKQVMRSRKASVPQTAADGFRRFCGR